MLIIRAWQTAGRIIATKMLTVIDSDTLHHLIFKKVKVRRDILRKSIGVGAHFPFIGC